MIAFKGVETIDDYLFVTKALPSVTGVDAKVVLADGTEKTIAVDEVEGNGASAKAEDAVIGTYGADGAVAANNIYSYTEDDGVYTLTALKVGTGDGHYAGIIGTGYVTANPSTSTKYYTIERDIAKMVGTGSGVSDVRLTTDTVFVDVKDNVIYKATPRLWTTSTPTPLWSLTRTARLRSSLSPTAPSAVWTPTTSS